MKPAIHHLKLTGNNPREWGRQQGEALRTQIQEMNAIRQVLLAGFLKSWTREKILVLCKAHAATLERQDAALFSETRGISEASGVSVEDLMALNAYTDMRDFSAGDHAQIEGGCSILAAKSNSVNFAAQTWDMHASAAPYMLLLEVPAPVPMHVLTITGCLGLCGVNEAGLSVMINNMHCSETNRDGIVWPGLVRKMLATTTTTEATDVLSRNIPSSGHNYLIFDPKSAVNIETSGLRYEQTGKLSESDAGYLVHTNHYVGTLKSIEIMERQSHSTHARMAALETFMKSHPVDTVKGSQLAHSLFVEGAACAVLNIPPEAGAPHGSATCGGIMVDHKTRRASIFAGLYRDNQIIEWELKS